MSNVDEPTLAEQDEERRAQGLPPVGYAAPDDWVSGYEVELHPPDWVSSSESEESPPPAA